MVNFILSSFLYLFLRRRRGATTNHSSYRNISIRDKIKTLSDRIYHRHINSSENIDFLCQQSHCLFTNTNGFPKLIAFRISLFFTPFFKKHDPQRLKGFVVWNVSVSKDKGTRKMEKDINSEYQNGERKLLRFAALSS